MARLDRLPAKDIIGRLKGNIDFYSQRGRFYARRWPNNRHSGFTPGARVGQSLFRRAVASAMAADADYRRLAAEDMSPCNWTWRDYLVSCWYSSIHTKQFIPPPFPLPVQPWTRKYYHPTFTVTGMVTRRHNSWTGGAINRCFIYTKEQVELLVVATDRIPFYTPVVAGRRGLWELCATLPKVQPPYHWQILNPPDPSGDGYVTSFRCEQGQVFAYTFFYLTCLFKDAPEPYRTFTPVRWLTPIETSLPPYYTWWPYDGIHSVRRVPYGPPSP